MPSTDLLFWAASFVTVIYIVYVAIAASLVAPRQALESTLGLARAEVTDIGDNVKGTDLVFVHGLAANPDVTWTAWPRGHRRDPHATSARAREEAISNKPLNWITDLLPGDLPIELKSTTRMYFHNHDSYWKRDALKFRLKHIADDLLANLRILVKEHAEGNTRSIILVAHSYGGLAVKEALSEASRTDKRVWNAIRGILFLGCPHFGAAFPEAIGLVARSLWLLDPHFEVFAEVAANAVHLNDLHKRYHDAAESRADKGKPIRTINFYEQKESRYFGFYTTMLVPEQSACFLGREVSRQPLPTDRSGLNKFDSRAAPGYQAVSKAIVDMLKGLNQERVEDDKVRHVIPFRLVSTFTDRPDLQHNLKECLEADCQDIKLAHAAAVSGAGGMGKTQLVLKYIEDHANKYDAILWIDARTADTIRASFRRCCDALGITYGSEIDDRTSVEDLPEIQVLLKWLKGRNLPGQAWLVIFDNADSFELELSKLIPEGSQGTMILVSRNNNCADLLGHRCKRMIVDTMEPSEAVSLLLKGTHEDPKAADVGTIPAAEAIASRLERLALAIDLAAAYIRDQEEPDVRVAMEQYLRDLERRQDVLLEWDEYRTSTAYDKTVWTVWDASLEVLARRNHHTSISLLSFLTLFDRTRIQDELFRLASLAIACLDTERCLGVLDLPDWLTPLLQVDSEGHWDGSPYRMALRPLLRYNLIRSDEKPRKAISMHQLIHWRASHTRKDDRHQEYYVNFMAAVSYTVNHDKTTVKFRRHSVVHLPLPKQMSKSLQQTDQRKSNFLYHEIATVWEREQRLAEAKTCFSQAVACGSTALGQTHKATLASRVVLARTYAKQSQRELAEETMEELLSIYLVVYGPEDKDTLEVLNRLSLDYFYNAKYERAFQLCQQSFEACTNALGPTHEETLWSMRNLARLHATLLRTGEAIELQRKALEIASNRPGLGPLAPYTLFVTSDLGSALQQHGNLSEAETTSQKALGGLTAIYGADNLLVQRCKQTLSQIFFEQDRLQDALALAKDTLESLQRAFGSDHDRTAECMHHLARLLANAGQEKEAVMVMEQAVETLTRKRGPDNVSTQAAEKSLREVRQRSSLQSEGSSSVERGVGTDSIRTRETRRGENPVP